tara:strand:+ start:174 stop:386 length:213 start_codon:yes stop_codon:yes gene_type:complete
MNNDRNEEFFIDLYNAQVQEINDECEEIYRLNGVSPEKEISKICQAKKDIIYSEEDLFDAYLLCKKRELK